MGNSSLVTPVDSTPKYTPIEDILALRDKNLPQHQIAKILDVSQQAVSERLQTYDSRIIRLNNFKKYKSEKWNELQATLLNSLSEDEIKKMPPGQRVICAGISEDKVQIIDKTQSLGNIDTQSVVYDVENMIRQCSDALQVGESETEEPDNTPDNNTSLPPTKPNIDSDE